MRKKFLILMLFAMVLVTGACSTETEFRSFPELSGLDDLHQTTGQVLNPYQGVFAFDMVDGDLTEQIEVSGLDEIPTNHRNQLSIPGTYTITYSVRNAEGAETRETRNVVVTGDALPEYELVWYDEFDYVGPPNPDKWNFDIGGGGWGNQELQYYTDRPENAYVDNGVLRISLIRESYSFRHYTSARLTTKDRAAWLYGRIEVRAKLPEGLGTWPAIWMLPVNSPYGGWPHGGEIDIMEHVGYAPNIIHSTIHTNQYNGMIGTQIGNSRQVPTATTAFHVYAVEWTETALDFYVDDTLIFSYPFIIDDFNQLDPSEYWKIWPFDQEFYLILNIAMGGTWGGLMGVDPNFTYTEMLIDYVRVYQRVDVNN